MLNYPPKDPDKILLTFGAAPKELGEGWRLRKNPAIPEAHWAGQPECRVGRVAAQPRNIGIQETSAHRSGTW